jgi:hypothetical protein
MASISDLPPNFRANFLEFKHNSCPQKIYWKCNFCFGRVPQHSLGEKPNMGICFEEGFLDRVAIRLLREVPEGTLIRKGSPLFRDCILEKSSNELVVERDKRVITTMLIEEWPEQKGLRLIHLGLEPLPVVVSTATEKIYEEVGRIAQMMITIINESIQRSQQRAFRQRLPRLALVSSNPG